MLAWPSSPSDPRHPPTLRNLTPWRTVATTAVRHTDRAGSENTPGLLSRLGAWTGSHLRAVLLLWLVILGGFGAFAPKVESSLSGAGWQDSGSSRCRMGHFCAGYLR